MKDLTTEEKYQQLRKYAHRLKLQLKEHSGESFAKGSRLDNKLHTYKKFKKLIQYYSQSHPDEMDDKLARQINSYYKVFETKLKKGTEIKTAHKTTHKKAGRVTKTEFAAQEKNEIEISVQKNSEGEKTDHNSDDDDDDDDDEITEVGPTPQLNGRVLTIFDIQTSPEKIDVSPLSGKRLHALEFNVNLINKESNDNDDDVFKTPSKPASKNQKDISALSVLSGASKKLNFIENQNENEITTPKKDISTSLTLLKTPQYIKNNTLKFSNIDNMILKDEWSEDDSDLEESDINIGEDDDTTAELNELEKLPDLNEEMNAKAEPSPLIKRTGRSLFQIHSDVRGLKRNLSTLQSLLGVEEEVVTEDSVIDLEKSSANFQDEADHKDNNVFNEYDPHASLRIKMKTIKRSTRRAKLKTDNVNLNDNMEHFDIHALARGEFNDKEVEKGHLKITRETPSVIQTDITSKFDMEDQDSDDDIYQRKDIQQLQSEIGTAKGKGKHPLSNNFVRLKINRGNRGGRFNRRR